MSVYDKDAISAIADPEMIASYIGMEVKKHGAYIFIRCPMHEKVLGKADSQIGNCIINNRGKKGFKCFSCGAHGDVFDMVTAFTGCSYPEALKIVGDACGGAESFREKKRLEKRVNTLSAEDLALIGLSYVYIPEESDEGRLLFNVSPKKEEETDKTGCARRKNEYLLYQKAERTNLRTLQRNSPKTYYALIERKAGEAAEKYRNARKDCSSKNSTISKDIMILFSSDGKLHMNEKLPKGMTEGIMKALKEKEKRAEGIRDEYRKLKEQCK